MSQEIWKDVMGYEGIYKVSSLGRVKSINRLVSQGDHLIKIKEKILKPARYTRGYLCVSLHKNGVCKGTSVHRIVAYAFLGTPVTGKDVVNHINGVITDNRPDNLEWCSHSENGFHSYRVLKRKAKARKTIIQMDMNGIEIRRHTGFKEFCLENGFNRANILKACKEPHRHSAGFKWRLVP